MRCKITTNFPNVQDFTQKNLVCARTSVIFVCKRLSFARKCERKFGGNPPLNVTTGRGRGVPKLLHYKFGLLTTKNVYILCIYTVKGIICHF